MSAYNRGELSIEAYLVRILAALAHQNGGELRVKGELIDRIGEPTAIIKEWDPTKQELVLRCGMGTFTEVYRVVPEKQSPRETIQVAPRIAEVHHNGEPLPIVLPSNSTIDDERVGVLERKKRVAQAAALLKQELERRRTANG